MRSNGHRVASVVEQGPEDGGDLIAGCRIDPAEVMDQPVSADAADQFTLGVARFIESGVGGWFDFHVQG